MLTTRQEFFVFLPSSLAREYHMAAVWSKGHVYLYHPVALLPVAFHVVARYSFMVVGSHWFFSYTADLAVLVFERMGPISSHPTLPPA